ncbi:alkaline phosphatase PhoX [Ramlibacter sp. AN1015]|uniref:alkaline phosphatase PhoX n=1 Tax=Ramlibacter sp. AN1015 TaxID=3133428 RepID=UPI0030BCBE63
MTSSRRNFMKTIGAGAMVAPLATLFARTAGAAPSFGPGFGALSPVLPLNTEELFVEGAFDLRNRPLLSLPPGFRYWAISCTGQTMSDGSLVPGDHDGMACFPGPRATTVLVRNHELSNRETKYGNQKGVDVAAGYKFDTYANGGTTTLVLDQSGRLLRDYASLGGTNNNCAGGPTPWGSWLTCEESTSLPNASLSTYQQRHGYVFEVPALADGPTQAMPILGMGRFNHEACAVDPRTGVVYQTEDTGDSLFYRYVPHHRGRLLDGGTLQALRLKDFPAGANTAKNFLGTLHQPLAVEWVDISDPDPLDNGLANSTRGQGQALGAARFARGEGAWYGDGRVYFCCTSGGEISAGQVWAYDPQRETVTLVVESTDRSVLEAPDNITVGPDGRLYMFEDGGGGNNIVGLNRSGELFRVAENAVNGSEFCGGCFSHDGRFMFVNIQSPGITLVVEGPWRKGQP